jgi:Bacteriocin-protection, YdeI or OmpD-Associated/Domain of unknown function (DUF1905)
MKFTAELLRTGKNTTGIEVPQAVLDALGGGKRPRVRIGLNGFAFSLTLGGMGGRVMVPVSAERRAEAGVSGGNVYEIDIAIDTTPQDIALPHDIAAILAENGLRAQFDALPPSRRKEHVRAITDAKSPETRARRIVKAIEMIAERQRG